MTLNPYIHFPGNCEEALNFYKQCLGGEVKFRYFGDSPMQVAEEHRKKIVHAEFHFDGNMLMASDSLPDHKIVAGNNFGLSIILKDILQMDSIFSQLAAGGEITMPLQDTFWDARFGMLTDKFGIRWMFNCSLKK
ncbi:MAG TPA: glyoxalase/bleomycin resistance/extradiol dioxygenase family protein [Chitinophagales bacterium]|nr:glyoxalase/bleomycin resistance/extradiol dioxygenase family protein [Chitinophagales bacterium]